MLACQPARHEALTIATAANMQYAMAELMESFSKHSGVACHMVVGSSGKLTAQIMEGAPYDVFVSADKKYPQALYEAGMTLSRPITYAQGHLVLWSTNLKSIALEQLTNSEVEHIAIANPETAPYGSAARELLNNVDLWEQVESKLVYGESVAQTNQFISSGAASMGITSESTVMAPINEHQGTWVHLDEDFYTPIEQALVLIKSTPDKEQQAAAFRDFVQTPEGKQILIKFGFRIPEQ